MHTTKSTWATPEAPAAAAVAALLGVLGCAHRPSPPPPDAPPAVLEAARPQPAVREVAGVQVVVSSGIWYGYPPNGDAVTPVEVTIRNKSGHPILIRYSDLALVDHSGRRYRALPPVPAGRPREGTQVFEPAYSSYGFSVSPDLD